MLSRGTSINPQNDFNGCKMKLIKIANTLKILKEHVGHISHEYLDMRKLCKI